MSQTLDQRIIAETTEYENIVQKLDDILNGDVNAVITVTSGTIPSIRKAVNDALNNLATASASNMGTTITEINNKIDAIETYLGDETNPAADTVRRLLIDLQASITTINNNIGNLATQDPQGSGNIAQRLASARQSGGSGGGGGISQATWDAARVGLPANAPDDDTAASLWAQFKQSLVTLGNKLNTATWTAARVGNPGDAADADTDASLWAQFKHSLTNTGGGGGISQTAFDNLSNLVGTRASITYYYFANFTATALSSANANTQSVWTWITRLSNSIKNLGDRLATLTSQVGDKLDTSTWTAARVGNPGDTASGATTASLWAQFKQSLTNTGGGGGISQATFQALAEAVGAVSDAANIAGTTLWNRVNQIVIWLGDPSNDAAINGTDIWSQFKQVKAWVGTRPNISFTYFGNVNSNNTISVSTDQGSVWQWLQVAFISVVNLYNKHNAQAAAIAAIDTGSAATTSRVVADITQEDATQDQWSIGNIVGDLLTGVLNYVKGTPTPIDYTIQLSSTARTGGSLGANESLIDGHWVFGFTRANVALPNIANTIPNSSLGEVAPNVTGDLGDDIDAVLNVTNHSLSSGYMLVAMKVDADYVPKNLRVRTSGGTETVNHSLQLSQTTATHKIYVTDHSDELQWGDVFGISSEGAFTADIGFRDANNENYLQGNVVKSFAPFPLSKYTRTFFGAMKDIPRVEKPGDMYIADDGDILISKEVLTGSLGYVIYPIPTGNRYFGFSAETIGAISTILAPIAGGVNFDIQKTITKLLYDSVNDEIVVDFNKKSLVVEGSRSLSVRTGQVALTSTSTRYSVINTPLVIKPEADSIGGHARYAGCKSPVNDNATGYKHPTITPGYSGTAATYFGASIQPIVGYKRTAGGTSYGTSSDNSNWKTGDTIIVDRSQADRAIRVTTRAESHTEIKGMVYGERLNFEEEGQRPVNENDPDTRRLHFRIPAANAGGELATPKGSRTNAAFNTGIYEVDLKFGETGSFVHLPLPANYISGSQKLALFLKPITPGAAADFDKMDLATDRYYVLTYHSSIHDYNTNSVPSANRYARHKWDLPADAAAQLSAHFSADINGSMFVGIAIIEETGSGNQRALDDIVSSWLPVPYEQIYVDGVHIDLQLVSFNQIRVGTTRSRMEVHYKTNSYTQAQRDKYYSSTTPETEKDIFVNGRAVAVNLKNRRGMYHIPFDITHIKPFVKDEPFYVNFDFARENLGRQTISLTHIVDSQKSIAWDRVVRAETHSYNETEDSLDITEGRFEVFDRDIEPDYTRQEKLAIDSVEDDYPSKYLAIPFDKGSVYERGSGSNANDMDDSDLISEKQSFAVDSDQIEGSVIIEDIYLNADNTGTNQITFRVGHDIANSSTVLPATIIHHPLSGAKLTIPGVAASTVRATKAYQDGKRVFNVSSGADWDKAVTLVKGDKISVQLMGGQAHNNPQLVWYKLIN